MSKRKRVAVTTAIICALFGIIYLAVSFLPYNKNSKWSSLYFEADLGKIYTANGRYCHAAFSQYGETDTCASKALPPCVAQKQETAPSESRMLFH